MNEKKRNHKEFLFAVVCIAVAAWSVLNVPVLVTWFFSLVGMLKPFIIGACIAFIVNLPLKFIEEKILAKLPDSMKNSKRTVSILFSFLFIFGIIVFVILTVIPQLGRTLNQVGQKIPVFLDNTFSWAEMLLADNPQAVEWLQNLEYQSMNWDNIISKIVGFLKNGVGSLVNSTVTVAGSVAGGIVSGVVALIFSIYILGQKEKLKNQWERILHAYCKESVETKVLYVSQLLYRNFCNFITGQCTEAVILGALFVVAMTVFKMPYAFMIGVLIAFTALIPIVGAFIGCFVGTFLIMVDNPVKAIWFIVLFLVIQQIEGNLIYPKVVGNSVGLPSLWVLLAVSLGSSMFGVVGMLVFIPLFSTFYTLLKEDVDRRNQKKTIEKKRNQNA